MSFALVSIGGAGFALIELKSAPLWLKPVILILAMAALINALVALPNAIDAIGEVPNRIDVVLPSAAKGVEKLSRKFNSWWRGPTYGDPFAFCNAVINKDNSFEMIDSQYSGPGIPEVVSSALGSQAAGWRCMDGYVYGCLTGASGRSCLQMDSSTSPSLLIRTFCMDKKNSDFVPMSAIGASSSTWKCVNREAVISETYPLDRRNYLLGSWQRLIQQRRKP